jgi:hypothetical protein
MHSVALGQNGHILRHAQLFSAKETSPMNKIVEVLLTVLALAGMYCAIPNNATNGVPVVRAEQGILIADGSDPMPLCRRRCK